MARHTIHLTSTGRRNPSAQGDDVFLLQIRPDGDTDGLALDTPRVRKNRTMVPNIRAGEGLEAPRALRLGHAPLKVKGRSPSCVVLRHPWSGLAEVTRKGAPVLEVDLYAPETCVSVLDLITGDLTDLSRAQTITLIAAMRAELRDGATRERVSIRVTGKRHAKSLGAEVIILAAEPEPEARPINLALACDGRNWAHVPTIMVDEVPWRDCAKGLKGELCLEMSVLGRLTFLTHEWSGVAEVSFRDKTVWIDLHAARMGSRDVILAELFDVPLAETDGRARNWMTAPVREPADLRSRISPYPGLIASFNPRKPIALYVPRWAGVATSTRNLFDQALPIPEDPTIHPDDLTQDDLDRYARILLASGATRFVISGGDTFFIDLIRQVQRYERAARFDLLWHSNFLQMGEAHDWSLLRAWLRAAEDGLIRRIGVVKDGLDEFLRAMGFDCVFVPNVLRSDPDDIAVSRNEDTVGLWLSGSSSYRKVPYAAIMAVKSVEGLSLKGSGLDPVAHGLVASLDVPFTRLWSEVLPQQQLYQEMRSTAVTLYVTLSECSPMLPLESFQQGVPCLVGPSSHLFRDDPQLEQALVVKDPLSPGLIAEHLQEVRGRREEIIGRYKDYAKREARTARSRIEALVN